MRTASAASIVLIALGAAAGAAPAVTAAADLPLPPAPVRVVIADPKEGTFFATIEMQHGSLVRADGNSADAGPARYWALASAPASRSA
jgi:hypothetical protein